MSYFVQTQIPAAHFYSGEAGFRDYLLGTVPMNDLSITILGVAFGLTLISAIAAVLAQMRARQGLQMPPDVPIGKVSSWFFRPGDLAGAFIVYMFFAGLFALACAAPPMEIEDFTAAAIIVSMMFQVFLCVVVMIAVNRHTPLNDWLCLRWNKWPWLFLIGPGAVVLMIAVFWVIQLTGYMEWMESLGVETIQETVTLLQEGKDPVVLGLLIITATIVAPICEEVVFRGYLHPILKKYGGIWAAAFCSSLLFSIAHGNLAVMLPLFILGVFLVWIYEYTGSIWAPIAVHFCFNATTVLAQMAVRFVDIPNAMLPYFEWQP